MLTASRGAPPPDPRAGHVPADLATEDGVRELGRAVTDRLGGVDVLVDNAGAESAPTPTLERSDRSRRFEPDITLLAAVRLNRELVPGMVERGAGVVVHVSSIASRWPQRSVVCVLPGLVAIAAILPVA